MKKTILTIELDKNDGISNYIIYLMNDDGVKIKAFLATGEEEKKIKIEELENMVFLENQTEN